MPLPISQQAKAFGFGKSLSIPLDVSGSRYVTTNDQPLLADSAIVVRRKGVERYTEWQFEPVSGSLVRAAGRDEPRTHDRQPEVGVCHALAR